MTNEVRTEVDGVFDRAFAVVLGHEGGYTADPADPGNWTGGTPGRGECRGTNWGISAASYPDLPIRALTPDQARAIYRRDYWDRVRGDRLPPPLALLVFDAAVNCGVGRAARWLQGALGVTQDGAVGEVTLAALRRRAADDTELCAAFQAARLLYMVSLPTWPRFGGGWAKRLCRLPFDAMTVVPSKRPSAFRPFGDGSPPEGEIGRAELGSAPTPDLKDPA